MRLTIVFCLLIEIVWAQPGPDAAGLLIYEIQHIDQVTALQIDPDFTYKQYILNKKGDKVLEEITGFNTSRFSLHAHKRPFVYLPPFDPNAKSEDKADHLPNQRLDLIYRGDTMRIDFIGITTKMSSAYTPQMSKLVFCPGYFKLFLDFEKEKSGLFDGETYEDQQLKHDFSKAYNEINFITDGLLTAHGLLVAERDNHRLSEMGKRDIREACSEKKVIGNYFVLCAGSIIINDKVADIKTQQNPKTNDGQSVYYFSYYHSFDNPLKREPIIVSDQEKNVNYQGYHVGKSEEQIALETYESLQKLKVKVNGTFFSGQLKFIESNLPWFDRGIYNGTGWRVRILTYKNGVLVKDEVVKEIQPTDK